MYEAKTDSTKGRHKYTSLMEFFKVHFQSSSRHHFCPQVYGVMKHTGKYTPQSLRFLFMKSG